ncbi:MAG: beta-phosphoglucomutase family hydrolase [Hymenobacter sp.]|nr:MAG: beta-phosphoglucomutase family hydrolase [Hymenobacter sp.]
MADLRGLIFDMDGVLVDNVPYHAQAFQALFDDLDLTTNATKLLHRLNGMPTTAILKSVIRHEVSKKQLEEYSTQREFLYRTLYRAHRRVMPGLVPFLNAAREAGFKIGLGTGSVNATLSYTIDYLDLRRHFDVVVGNDDVQKGKPHAETFAVVAQKLGLDPAECVVFEDAILGEQAAYRAQMRCVGLSTTLEAKEFQAPLTVLEDYVGFTPDKLRELFALQAQAPKPNKELASRQYAQQE